MGDDELLVTQHVESFLVPTPPNIVVHLRPSHMHPDGLRPMVGRIDLTR
jgi:hypothetical protein